MQGNTNIKLAKVPIVAVYSSSSVLPFEGRIGSNTITVISATPKNKVYISDKAPENPQNGDVWVIQYDPAGIWGDGIISAVQYNGSNWLNREAYYHPVTGLRFKLATTLFCEGTQFPQTTGAWTAYNGTLQITNNALKYTTISDTRVNGYYFQTANTISVNEKMLVFGQVQLPYGENKIRLGQTTIDTLKLPCTNLYSSNIYGTAIPLTLKQSYSYQVSQLTSGNLRIGAPYARSYGNEITISAIFVQ